MGRVTRTFAVEGADAFPIDLLRRDRCWPATAADAHSIALDFDVDDPAKSHIRYVRLETEAAHAPTRSTWRARGWPVIDDWPEKR